MILIVSALRAGVFAGAAIYVNFVEHPARLSCGTELAVREFAPSRHRATIMQVPLALTVVMALLPIMWVEGVRLATHGWRLPPAYANRTVGRGNCTEGMVF